MNERHEKRPSDYAREILAIERRPAKLQSGIDSVVLASLERSGLIEPMKPLRNQRGNKKREWMVDALFFAACAEAAGRE